MPSIDWNRQVWATDYHWTERGDEWSKEWGGAQMQWFGTILPRISSFIPTGVILEIAPGYGRWTQFLKGICARLIAVDLSERCIESCRQRFSEDSHVELHVNDGKSLAMIPDASIDFAFSFDSLVHVELEVLEAYASELARVLRPEGVAFLHHSNLGAHSTHFRWAGRFSRGRGLLSRLGLIEKSDHGRSWSVTASAFRTAAERHGLACPSQETVNWGTRRDIDCLTVLTPRGSAWARPAVQRRNQNFMREARCQAMLSELYALRGLRKIPPASESHQDA